MALGGMFGAVGWEIAAAVALETFFYWGAK